MMMHLTTFSALALALPGTDWLYQFTNNLTRPNNGQWRSAHESRDHVAEHHSVLSASEYGCQL